MEAKAASATIQEYAIPRIAYSTDRGLMYQSKIEDFLASEAARALRGQVQLVFTSPPFPLNRKKKYGNRVGEEYLAWLGGLAEDIGDLLTDDGSLVVELGNAWEQGEPVMSTLALEALLCLMKDGDFKLCQQFVVHNPARLPSPAQWVNVERCRVKDAYTNVWWMSRASRPKADNRKVLVEYSAAMKKLLKRQSYNAGTRPSEHNIGQTSFLENNGGAIPSNVLTISNTVSRDSYRTFVKKRGLKIHPARMPPELAEFFIRFLTDEGDLVFDPFGGSNTTGAAAETLNREWLATEPQLEYIIGSKGRFTEGSVRDGEGRPLDPGTVVQYLRRRGAPATRREIAAALGLEATPQQWHSALNALLVAGELIADGLTRGRRYAVPA